MAIDTPLNVFDEPLQSCCTDPMTGYYRDGFCNTSAQDVGTHVVCAIVTKEFLDFSRSRGNNLMSPMPEYGFPGLTDGDGWCPCAMRWKEAHEAGVAPPVKLKSTHKKALQYIPLEVLKGYDISESSD